MRAAVLRLASWWQLLLRLLSAPAKRHRYQDDVANQLKGKPTRYSLDFSMQHPKPFASWQASIEESTVVGCICLSNPTSEWERRAKEIQNRTKLHHLLLTLF